MNRNNPSSRYEIIISLNPLSWAGPYLWPWQTAACPDLNLGVSFPALSWFPGSITLDTAALGTSWPPTSNTSKISRLGRHCETADMAECMSMRCWVGSTKSAGKSSSMQSHLRWRKTDAHFETEVNYCKQEFYFFGLFFHIFLHLAGVLNHLNHTEMYSFEGNFKRKPIQSLGGVSKKVKIFKKKVFFFCAEKMWHKIAQSPCGNYVIFHPAVSKGQWPVVWCTCTQFQNCPSSLCLTTLGVLVWSRS